MLVLINTHTHTRDLICHRCVVVWIPCKCVVVGAACGALPLSLWFTGGDWSASDRGQRTPGYWGAGSQPPARWARLVNMKGSWVSLGVSPVKMEQICVTNSCLSCAFIFIWSQPGDAQWSPSRGIKCLKQIDVRFLNSKQRRTEHSGPEWNGFSARL